MAILKPEREDRLLGAWNLDPATATDAQSRVAAQTLAKEALTANVIAEMPEESFKTEEERAMICRRGEEMIRDAVEKFNLDGVLRALGDYQAYVRSVVEKNPRLRDLG